MWEIEGTQEFAAWYNELSDEASESVDSAVRALELSGPSLGRPFADTLEGSRHSNMKELRPRGGHLRIIFAFDPRRVAILLVGGDKSGEWHKCYQAAIPWADKLYDDHLHALKKERNLSNG
jgi:hypothetical protein